MRYVLTALMIWAVSVNGQDGAFVTTGGFSKYATHPKRTARKKQVKDSIPPVITLWPSPFGVKHTSIDTVFKRLIVSKNDTILQIIPGYEVVESWWELVEGPYYQNADGSYNAVLIMHEETGKNHVEFLDTRKKVMKQPVYGIFAPNL